MELGLVSTFAVKCGIATYSTYLGEELQKNKKVSVTGLSEFPYPNESALDKDFKPSFPFFNCWSRSTGYDQLVENSKNYDGLHLQHQFGLFSNEANYIKLLKNIKKPLITTLHDVVSPNPMAIAQMGNYMNETIVNSAKIIVHTKTCYDLLTRWNCPTGKIVHIPHGTKLINVPSKEDARKKAGIPEDAVVLLSWGFIWESKGILDLVNILAEVKKTYPNAMLIHAGGVHPIIQGSQYLTSILKTAVRAGLTPKDLVITNWVPEDKIPMWFGTADVILLNYMRGSASASGAAHRALSAHRPIVGTDDPCIEEIPKQTVARFDINGLYQSILQVLDSEELQKSLVQQAEKAAEETSWENVAKQHLKLYKF